MQNEIYTIPLSKIIEEFQLEVIYTPDDPAKIVVSRNDLNRPGLKLSGFGKLFDRERIQVIGRVEYEYLNSLSEEARKNSFRSLVDEHPVSIVFTTDLPISDDQTEACRRAGVPLLRTKMLTSAFMAALIASLNVSLAPRITRHGVLVEVYGEGILMLGDSGVGKSETAIELVKRGHRLIADDAVKYVRREEKREKVYEGIVLDPPAYGHGARGEVWRLTRDLPKLLSLLSRILAPEFHFILLTCHSPGFDASRLSGILSGLQTRPARKIESGAMEIIAATGAKLPAGYFALLSSPR